VPLYDAFFWAMGIIGVVFLGLPIAIGLVKLSGIILRKTGDLLDRKAKKRRPVRVWIR
jgi:hypothetical protein